MEESTKAMEPSQAEKERQARALESAFAKEAPDHIMQFFAYQHLPIHLQDVSALFFNLAEQIVNRTPRNPERTVALRKLLESKDAAVRAAFAK